jgi:Rrf2 family protein
MLKRHKNFIWEISAIIKNKLKILEMIVIIVHIVLNRDLQQCKDYCSKKKREHNMQLSRKSDYALRAVMHLAGLPEGQLSSIGAVAEAQSIPREFLAKILKDMTWAGILVSFRGVAGGYRLARAPKDVTFLDVIEAMDGPVKLNLCVASAKSCDHSNNCTLREFWLKEQDRFIKVFSKANFQKYKAVLKKK